jgi:hypothetical protein
MKKMLSVFVLLWVLALDVVAAPLTAEQNEVTQFIVKLYSHNGSMFEMGRFNGNYNPKKHCEFLKEFLEKNLMESNGSAGCESYNMRYPSLSSEDLSGPWSLDPLPRPKISTPIIDGDRASVEVMYKLQSSASGAYSGRTLYFLIKTSEGWRIENADAYEAWPPVKGSSLTECPPHEYLTTPTGDQKKREPTGCR